MLTLLVLDVICIITTTNQELRFNILQPTGYAMHQQFNIQQL